MKRPPEEAAFLFGRSQYRESFQRSLAALSGQFELQAPAGGFCLWLPVGGDDRQFAVELYQQQGVKVLPGSFLARDLSGQPNPGQGYVRAALVHRPEVCAEASARIASFVGESWRQ